MARDWGQSVVDAHKLLRSEKRWVVDLSSLTELVTLGHQDLLAFLPDVHVATAVRDVLASKLESTAIFKTSGTMFTHEGKLGFRENTLADWQRDRDFFSAMLSCIDKHCKVVPAYGPVDVEHNVVLMRQILSADEYATLLLSLELNASVLSLDDRFRRICAMLGSQGVWPQPFFNYMLVNEHMEPDDHMLSVLKLMLGRRTFVSIDHFDLVRLMAMDDDFAQFGLNSFREYLAEPTLEFWSGSRVLFNFLATLRACRVCSMDVIVELLEHLSEGLFRHPLKPEGWFAGAVYQAWMFLGLRTEFSRSKAVSALTEAEERAGHPPQAFQIDLGAINRGQLPFKGEQPTSMQEVDKTPSSELPAVSIPTKKEDTTGTTGTLSEDWTPEMP
ncbi:MAG: hypothetical protein EON54_22790 [Alcaligenaceae bacterium]|nr:MAG: hypothetical protein EON54_22790 [Alcaligenaceae bacterium]